MNTVALQVLLFQSIKIKISADKPLVDEIAAALNISTDSAYRRIRGEKPISFEELYILCSRYRLSLDALLNLKTDIISFEGKFVEPVSFRFEDYLAAVVQQLKYMVLCKEPTMYYLCKDIPIFHHFQSRELAAFKHFFWHKTLLQSPDFVTLKLSLSHYPDDVFAIGKKVLELYNHLTSHEIWNMESLNSTLRQVEYYHDTRVFQTAEDLLAVYESLEKLFDHLEEQAELGYKFDAADPDKKPQGRFSMYFNEVVIGDNSILAVLDGVKHAFLSHSGINFMTTRDVHFCENLYSYYQNLIRKSTLISSVNERDRSQFFKVLRKRIATRKQNLKIPA